MWSAVGLALNASLRYFFFFQAEDGIRDWSVTGVQTCALPIFAVEAVHVDDQRRRVLRRAVGSERRGLREIHRTGWAARGAAIEPATEQIAERAARPVGADLKNLADPKSTPLNSSH